MLCFKKYREINYPPRFFIAAFIFTTLSVKISSTLILCRSFQVDKCLYKSMANVLSKLYVNRINFFQRNSLLDNVCNYVRCMRDESNYLIMRCWRKFFVCVYYEEVYKHWIQCNMQISMCLDMIEYVVPIRFYNIMKRCICLHVLLYRIFVMN